MQTPGVSLALLSRCTRVASWCIRREATGNWRWSAAICDGSGGQNRGETHAPPQELRSARRHPGGAAAVRCRSRHRRGELPQASARRGGDDGHLRHHHQRAFHRGRLLHLRGAAARAGDRAGRDRRPPAADQRHLGRRQPRGGAPRPHGGRGRRLRAAGVPAGAVHARAVAGRWRWRTSSASPTRPTCR